MARLASKPWGLFYFGAALTTDLKGYAHGNGNKSKTNRVGDPNKPKAYDSCQTPPHAIDPLLPYVPMDWTIWEPAAGEGLLVKAFSDAGFQVVETDILSGQNFFEYEPATWHALITNPPYSIKYQWLERCYELGRPFALLMPIETLGAKRAQVEFIVHGNLEVIFLNKRINFKMPHKGWDGAGAQFPVAWFTWGLNIGQQITFVNLPNVEKKTKG